MSYIIPSNNEALSAQQIAEIRDKWRNVNPQDIDPQTGWMRGMTVSMNPKGLYNHSRELQYLKDNGFWDGTMFSTPNTKQITSGRQYAQDLFPPTNEGNSSGYTRQINAQVSPDMGNTKMLFLPPTPDKFSVGHGEWLTPQEISKRISPQVQAPTDIGNTQLRQPMTNFPVVQAPLNTLTNKNVGISPQVQAPTDILEKKVNQPYGVSQNMQMQQPSANFTRIGGQARNPINQQNSRKVASKPSLGYDYLRSIF